MGEMWQKVILLKTGCLIKAKESNLPYYSLIIGGRRE